MLVYTGAGVGPPHTQLSGPGMVLERMCSLALSVPFMPFMLCGGRGGAAGGAVCANPIVVGLRGIVGEPAERSEHVGLVHGDI